MKPHPTKPGAYVLDKGEYLPPSQVVRHAVAMPCAESFWEGGCRTVRQCICCGRWQCVDNLPLLLCTACRRWEWACPA